MSQHRFRWTALIGSVSPRAAAAATGGTRGVRPIIGVSGGYSRLSRAPRAKTSARLVAALLWMLSFTGGPIREYAPAAEPMAYGRPPKVLADFRIAKGADAVFVPVKINGVQLRLLLDTGAEATGFHIAHRAALGPPLGRGRLRTPSGATFVETFKAPEINFGDRLACENMGKVACFDLQAMADVSGERIDGILGMDYLLPLVFSIDFDKGRLRFYTHADDSFGRRVHIVWKDESRSGSPFVRAAVNGEAPQKFLIDTGGISLMSGSLNPETYDRLVRQGGLVPSARYSGSVVTVGAPPSAELDLAARAQRLSVAGYVHFQPIFGRMRGSSSLGIGYLSRYFVAFDFGNDAMYVRAGDEFGRPDLYDLSGLEIERHNGKVQVRSLGDASAAAEAGMQKGDIIAAMNGRNAADMSLFAIYRVLSTEGRHTLNIHRNGAQKHVALRLMAEDGTTGKQDTHTSADVPN